MPKEIAIPIISTLTVGYGTDPNLVSPSTPWSHTLSEEQRKLAAALSDTILPAKNEFPAPSKMGIVDFLDEWVSSPYPQQQNDNKLILSGLKLVESQSRQKFNKGFVDLTEDQKQTIVWGIASDTEAGSGTPGRLFFKRFRYLVIGGYFTSDIGLKAIGYVGNTPMQSYPGISSEVHNILEEELKRLGLS
ncbi:gluconate 2-dehydrogenase subunit 3 family protein [Vogesella sp. EB]|uniref:gluconate 2-dehydrogenase subunit 3 family protein n=1 Tax=Vogesella sp. EB TaxID=1526735 RepID=UPI0009E1D993|nr:gluconate 2-dehydrogenase subunit 3 family protein [Vogesella sp. EB]